MSAKPFLTDENTPDLGSIFSPRGALLAARNPGVDCLADSLVALDSVSPGGRPTSWPDRFRGCVVSVAGPAAWLSQRDLTF